MSTANQARFTTLDSIESFPYIPDDLVFRILERLPVESLLRFKTACKKWRTRIQQKDFVISHCENSPIVPFTPDDNHAVIDYCGGIVIEQNLNSTKLRVRNPGLRLVLDLPDPSKTSSIMDFTQFKLVSFYEDEEGNKDCQILTFNDDNLSWKTLPTPLEFSNKNRKVFCCLEDEYGVISYFWTDNSYESGKKFKIGFESFDVKSECFIRSTYLRPPDFFLNFPKVEALRCYGRFIVYAIENDKMKLHTTTLANFEALWRDGKFIVSATENDKMKLHTTRLANFEGHIWSERAEFDLKFLEAKPRMRSLPLSLVEVSKDDEEFIFCSKGNKLVVVDRDMEVVKWTGKFIKDNRILWPLDSFKGRQTLIAFKGMQPQTTKT